MNTLRRVSAVVAGLLVLSSMLACGITGKVREAAARQKMTNDLKQLGLMYHNFNDLKKRGPKDSAELQAFETDPQGKQVAALTGPGGQYVLIWNVKISDLVKSPGGTSGTILGYEARASGNGALVLMADASVRIMTEAEYNSTPKAKPAGATGKK
jgi:hypothetical protein